MNGPALVLAGPGSGKTTVMIERIRYLVEDKGVSPEKILVVTFARSAAVGMKERFLALTSGRHTGVTFSTIHSVCYSILNSGNSSGRFRLLQEKEKKNFLSETIKEYFKKHSKHIAVPGILKDVLSEIALFKRSGTSLDEYKTRYCDHVLFVFCCEKFRSFKDRYGYFDFDDMANMTDELLASGKCADGIAGRYEYLLVDEFQDTGEDQFRFLKKLCSGDNFFAVGDEDQSIYGFRGASPEIMLGFKDYFPRAVIYNLPENYRSQKKIVDLANDLISNNKKRYVKNLISKAVSNADEKIDVFCAGTAQEEIDLVLSHIRRIKEVSGSTAVLVRTRRALEMIAGNLIKSNIGFYSGEKAPDIFAVSVIETVMSFFKMICGKEETSDYIRIFRTCDININEVLLDGDNFDKDRLMLVPGYKEKIIKLESEIMTLKKFTPPVALEFIRNVIGLDKKASEFDKAKLDEFSLLIKDLQSAESVLGLVDSYEAPFGNFKKDGDIFLSTIHGAKGLEFDTVFIPFMNEGQMPYSKAITDNGIEEERRLFYVAVTRARNSLILSRHESERSKKISASRFLSEIKIQD